MMEITIESAATPKTSRLSRIEFRIFMSECDEADPVMNNSEASPYIMVNQILEAEVAKLNFAHMYANTKASEACKAPRWEICIE